MNKPHKLAILCAPRCASTWCAQSILQSGISFGHEALTGSGGVGWWLALDNDIRDKCEHVIHIVRDPLSAIASIMAWFIFDSRCYYALDDHIGGDEVTRHQTALGRAMAMYYESNRLSRDKSNGQSYTMRHYPKMLIELLLGIDVDWIAEPVNTRKHVSLTWGGLYICDEALAHKIGEQWREVLNRSEGGR